MKRPGLVRTPERVADMFAEILSGPAEDAHRVLTSIAGEGHREMVLVKGISFHSMCEHHLLPFFGSVHVAYIPMGGRVTGLSKVVRAVDIISSRLQLQERLTTEIADTIADALRPRGVLVVVEAEHLCMSMRGVRKPGCITVTSAVRGIFKTNELTRAEAMDLLRK